MRDIEPVQVLVLDDELHLAKIGVTLGEAVAKELRIAAGRLLPIDVVHARFTVLLKWSRFLRRTGIHFGGKRSRGLMIGMRPCQLKGNPLDCRQMRGG
jgi:hypothetical protein